MDDTDAVRDGLRADAAGVLRALGLSEPTSQAGTEWRFGRKGSLVVQMAGTRAGLWHDFSTGEGGDLLDLIRRVRGGEIGEAFAWSRQHLGLPERLWRVASTKLDMSRYLGPDGIRFSPEMAALGEWPAEDWDDDPAAQAEREARDARRKAARAEQAEREQRAAESDESARCRRAERIWNEARPIAGTPAEAYLAARGVPLPDGEALRFHPKLRHTDAGISLPAMLAAIREHDGTFRAIHITYLDREAPRKASVQPARRISASPRTGAVWLTQGRGPHLHVAEGIETALSVLRVDPGACVAAALSTGGLIRLELPPETTDVTILVDDDGPKE